MFTPPLNGSQNSSRFIELSDDVTTDYFHSLRPVDLADVELSEVAHTLYSDAARLAAASFKTLGDKLEEINGWYRDALGTLIAHEHHDYDHDRLWLLWPVAEPIVVPTEETTVESGGEMVFVRDSGAGPIAPLPAATVDSAKFTWGYPGSGPLYLYRALVHAVTGEDALTPVPETNNLPFSLLGWIHSLEHGGPWRITWPELVAKVEGDRPIRERLGR